MNSIIEQIQTLHTRIQDLQEMRRYLVVESMSDKPAVDPCAPILARYERQLAQLEQQFEDAMG